MMDIEFWRLIDASVRLGGKKYPKYLAEKMSANSGLDILNFFRIYLDAHCSLKLRNVWGAATVINSSFCDDECFDAFRNFVIISGRSVFDVAITSPDYLYDAFIDKWSGEVGFFDRDIKNALLVAYYKVAGKSIFDSLDMYTDDFFMENINVGCWRGFLINELMCCYPRLWGFYGEKFSIDTPVIDEYEVARIKIDGLGIVKQYDKINHSSHGVGKVMHIINYPNNCCRAAVLFKDGLKDLALDPQYGINIIV